MLAVALPPSEPDAAANDRWPEPARRAEVAAPSNARVIAELQSFRLALALTGGDLAAVPRLMKPAEATRASPRECGPHTEGGAGVGGARPHSLPLAHDRPRVLHPATVGQGASVVTRTSERNVYRTEGA